MSNGSGLLHADKCNVGIVPALECPIPKVVIWDLFKQAKFLVQWSDQPFIVIKVGMMGDTAILESWVKNDRHDFWNRTVSALKSKIGISMSHVPEIPETICFQDFLLNNVLTWHSHCFKLPFLSKNSTVVKSYKVVNKNFSTQVFEISFDVKIQICMSEGKILSELNFWDTILIFRIVCHLNLSLSCHLHLPETNAKN